MITALQSCLSGCSLTKPAYKERKPWEEQLFSCLSGFDAKTPYVSQAEFRKISLSKVGVDMGPKKEILAGVFIRT